MTTRSVYVISATAIPVKIGVATDVNARLADLQIGSPDKLKVRHAVHVDPGDAFTVENLCHRALDEYSRHGEWFDVPVATAVCVLEMVAAPFTAARVRAMYRRGADGFRIAEGFDCSAWKWPALQSYAIAARCGWDDMAAPYERRVLMQAGEPGLAVLRHTYGSGRALKDVVGRDRKVLSAARKLLGRAVGALAEEYALQQEQPLVEQVLAA